MAKSPKRKDYLKDYTRGSDGRYSYGGKNYKFDGTEQERLEAYKKMIALAVLLIASVILSGCIDAAGATGAFYVILPLVGEICALFALVWYMSKLIMEGREIRGYIFETANNRIPPAAQIIIIFALTGLGMSAIYLIFNGFEGKLLKSLLYLFSKGLNAVLAFYFKKYYNTLRWRIM